MFIFNKAIKHKYNVVKDFEIEEIEKMVDHYKELRKEQLTLESELEARRITEELDRQKAAEEEEAEKKEISQYATRLKNTLAKEKEANERYLGRKTGIKESQIVVKEKESTKDKPFEIEYDGDLGKFKRNLEKAMIEGKISNAERITFLNKVDPISLTKEQMPTSKRYNFARYGDREKTHTIEDERLKEIAENVDSQVCALGIKRVTRDDIKAAKFNRLKFALSKRIDDKIDDIAKSFSKIDAINRNAAIEELVERLIK